MARLEFGGDLEGKTAIVTGGSRGIGRAVVERLAREGVTVVFSYAQNTTAALEVEKAVDNAGGRAHALQVDLADTAAVETFLDRALDQLGGGLDVLVNNAAAPHTATHLVDLTDDDYDRIMAVNAKAVFVALRFAAKRMRDGGRIVNISTINTVLAAPGLAAYAGSKGAVEQFAAVAARELGARGITVNTVSPGATDTELLRSTNADDALQMVQQMTPLGRIGQPADVADIVAFLTTSDARWLTGQNIRAGGGLA